MTKNQKEKQTAKGKRNVNRPARELIDKSGLNVAGEDYDLNSLIRERMESRDRDALLDSVASDWRTASKRADKLYDIIEKKTDLIAEYYECRNFEQYAHEDAAFALGFAAAARLLGK